MYIITDHRNETPFVILGPTEWRSKYFSFILSEELETKITITDADKDRVPFSIMEGVIVRECEITYENLDFLQMHEGPFISYNDDNIALEKAIVNYTAVYKNIEIIKKEFKDKIANLRWKKETEFIPVTINDQEYYVDLSRSNRDALTQKYIAMAEGDTVNWKFKFRWATLTKDDVLMLLKNIDQRVQQEFDEEIRLLLLIESAQNHEDLRTVLMQQNLI